jgi:uncharacterized membrane protein YqiK
LPEIPVTLMVVLALVAIAMVLLVALGMNIKKLYIVPKANEILIRTGKGGVVVSKGGGMLKLPWIHEVAILSAEAVTISIVREHNQALRTADKYLANVKATMIVQVDPEKPETAAQALGSAGPEHLEAAVRRTSEDIVDDAMRNAAFKKTFEALNADKDEISDGVRTSIGPDLEKLGIKLLAVTITDVNQQPFDVSDNSVFTAEGRRNEAATTQKNRQETNLITRNAEIAVQKQDVEAREKALELELHRKQKEADQVRSVSEYEAEQSAETKKKVLAQAQEEAVALANQERAIAEAQASAHELAEKAEIGRIEKVAVRQFEAQAEQKEAAEKAAIREASAAADRAVAEEEAAQRKEEAQIAKMKKVEEAQIAKDKAVKVASEERQQAIETAEVGRQKAVSMVRAEEAAARADEAVAQAKQTEAEESIVTVQERARADRKKVVAVVAANESREMAQINADRSAYVEAKAAEGERDAAIQRAEAVAAEAKGIADAQKAEATGRADALLIEAEAYATNVSTRATADAEAADKQAAARTKLAEAALAEGTAAAESARLMVEAENKVATELLVKEVVIAAIAVAPAVVREIMAPVAAVTHDVKVLQINGLGGGEGGSESTVGTVMGTGLALTGLLPVVKNFVSAAVENEDVQGIASALTGVATKAISEGAKAVKATPNGAEH